MTTKATLRSIARLLLVIGGIILILEAVLQLSGDIRGLLNLAPRIPSLDLFTSAIVSILVGVLALVGAGRVSSPAWGIISAGLRVPLDREPWRDTRLHRGSDRPRRNIRQIIDSKTPR